MHKYEKISYVKIPNSIIQNKCIESEDNKILSLVYYYIFCDESSQSRAHFKPADFFEFAGIKSSQKRSEYYSLIIKAIDYLISEKYLENLNAYNVLKSNLIIDFFINKDRVSEEKYYTLISNKEIEILKNTSGKKINLFYVYSYFKSYIGSRSLGENAKNYDFCAFFRMDRTTKKLNLSRNTLIHYLDLLCKESKLLYRYQPGYVCFSRKNPPTTFPAPYIYVLNSKYRDEDVNRGIELMKNHYKIRDFYHPN